MKIVQKLVAVSALLGFSIAIASDTPYRLAGIVTANDGTTLTLVETADGTQRLLRQGDSIDGGTVAEITRNTVRLLFENKEVVLTLAGTNNPESSLPTVYRPEDYMGGAPRRVDPDMLDAISQLASSADTMDSKKLAAEVLVHLGLPAKARIMAINDQSVESPAEAVRRMAANIDEKAGSAAGFRFVVSIADESGNSRVYIMADDSGQIDDQTITAN